ncbi:hypothetical protein KKF91_21435 [Myxococcota bacterium]|nr:hypothetical protein [Myxococcota bacterium]MBU1433109.1 hypothetical protein [Myxococcota bacterium]MBU1900260.1 hypothetical protein [Myxococcota bacterium]
MKRLRRLLFENFAQKLTALMLAAALVAVKREDKTSVLTVAVQVHVSHPPNRVLVTPPIDKVHITVEGKYSAIRRFQAETIPKLEVPLSGLEGDQFPLEPEMFKVPPELKVRTIRPSALMIRFEERKKATVAVKQSFEGEPVSGYRVTHVNIEPDTVVVEGSASAVERLEVVHTAPISLVGRDRPFSVSVALKTPPGYMTLLNGGRRHQVTVRIEEKRGTMVVAGRPVLVKGVVEGERGFKTSPSEVDVTLHGPVQALNQIDPQWIAPYVDVSKVPADLKVVKPGSKLEATQIRFDPPEGLSLYEIKPREVTLIRAREGEAEGGVDAGVDEFPGR